MEEDSVSAVKKKTQGRGQGRGADGRCVPCEVERRNPEDAGFSSWITRLVHDHRAQLAQVARREGLTAADAFDAVQEAFNSFILLPQANDLAASSDDDARKFLVALTRNIARNRRRLHAAARPHVSDPQVVDALPDAAPRSDQLLESIEQREQLARCVGELVDAQRAVVTLRMLDEVPGQDVARMLGIEPGYVAVLLHRAKANLATCMSQSA
jgi:RNA polymerase sigma-70 factor (ECF subfamily)